MTMRLLPIALALGGCASLSSPPPYWDRVDDVGWGWKTTQVIHVTHSPYSGSELAWTIRNPKTGTCTIYMTRKADLDYDFVLGHEYLHCVGLNHRSHPTSMSFSWAPTSILNRR